MSSGQSGLLRVLRAIWIAKSKVNRADVEKLADQLDKEGVFDEDKKSTPPSNQPAQ